MSTLAARRANLFKGTRVEGLQREPGNQSLEIEALAVIRASIEAHAASAGRRISGNDLDRMLSAAQSQLRGLSLDDLRSISPSSSLVKTITDYSMAAAAAPDAKTAPGGQPVAGKEQEVADGQPRESLTARLHRIDLERAARANASSARFSSLAGDERLSPSALQNIAGARAEAMRLGMPWAANNPELLKLGPAAIKTLHEAGVQRERFERMTGDKVGFRASTAVAIAAFAKRHNLTHEETNRLYDKISNGAEIVSGGSRTIQRELDQATNAYVTGADTPEARDKLRQAWDKHADTPEKKAAAAQASQAIVDAANQTRAKEAKADVKVQEAVAKKTEDLGDLEGPPPADTKKEATVPPAAPVPAASGSPPAKAPPAAKPAAPK